MMEDLKYKGDIKNIKMIEEMRKREKEQEAGILSSTAMC